MIYPDTFELKTGFDRIREQLTSVCLSPAGIRKVEGMKVTFSAGEVRRRLSLTDEFQQLLQGGELFPSENYNDPHAMLEKIRIEGSFPELDEVVALRGSLDTIRRIIGFFKNRKDGRYPDLTAMALKVTYYPFVTDAIDRIIDKEGKVRDGASPALKVIRADLSARRLAAVRKLHAILRQAQADGIVERDTMVAVRNGRGVIPVSAANKRGIRGFVHDESASGKTVFIEPAEVVELNNEITELEHEEKREIVRILTSLADTLRPYIDDLTGNLDFLAEIDFIKAKAQFGIRLQCIRPPVADAPHIRWINARHPLLTLSFERSSGREVVPLTIRIDSRDRILVISGPNAGGKSVCLKTVALVQYMLQCGMTIPVAEGTETGIFSKFFIDIGDEQSIENDLSTYSSHLINMKQMLKHADDRSLLMIDEFGTGTEPVIGGAIAEAILAELNRRRVYGVITTHYTNLKHFATSQEGISNGAMAFDNQLMQPLFRLDQGKPGSSFAFEIAKKIGLPQDILSDAASRAGEGNIDFDRNLREIARDKRYWERKREAVRQHEKRLEELIATYESQLGSIKTQQKEILGQAKNKAEEMLRETNKMIENTIRTIRETQAEKEKTKEVREELESFREHLTTEEKQPEIPVTAKPQLDNAASSIVRRVSRKPEPKAAVKKKTDKIARGDYVRLKGTDTIGEVAEVRGRKLQIISNSLRMNVDMDNTEPVSADEYSKEILKSKPQQKIDWSLNTKRNQFNPEIDVRGKRTEEALQVVQDFIDTALMIQYRHLRILHGKGNGILRQMIRQYLVSTGAVKSAMDEHVDRGGAGVTIVELDI
jgi:DNA mismatch repair protein MutS2